MEILTEMTKEIVFFALMAILIEYLNRFLNISRFDEPLNIILLNTYISKNT